MVFCQLSDVFLEFYESHETMDKVVEGQRQRDGGLSGKRIRLLPMALVIN